jgi:hypothetical protein
VDQYTALRRIQHDGDEKVRAFLEYPDTSSAGFFPIRHDAPLARLAEKAGREGDSLRPWHEKLR